jgi:hypothetical protein
MIETNLIGKFAKLKGSKSNLFIVAIWLNEMHQPRCMLKSKDGSLLPVYMESLTILDDDTFTINQPYKE